MFVCICHAVTEDEVTSAVSRGAQTLDAVAHHTNAGRSCGTCHDTIETMIEQACGSCPARGARFAEISLVS